MARSCTLALSDVASNPVECNPGGRGQPERQEKIKRIMTGLEDISLKQRLSGIPNTRKERGKPVNQPRTLALFLKREPIRSMTGGSSPSVTYSGR